MLGYSKRQAREIAARGFKALAQAEHADDTDSTEALIERINRLLDERQS